MNTWIVPAHLEKQLSARYHFRRGDTICGKLSPGETDEAEGVKCFRDIGHSGPHRCHNAQGLHLWDDHVPAEALEMYIRLLGDNNE